MNLAAYTGEMAKAKRNDNWRRFDGDRKDMTSTGATVEAGNLDDEETGVRIQILIAARSQHSSPCFWNAGGWWLVAGGCSQIAER